MSVPKYMKVAAGWRLEIVAGCRWQQDGDGGGSRVRMAAGWRVAVAAGWGW